MKVGTVSGIRRGCIACVSSQPTSRHRVIPYPPSPTPSQALFLPPRSALPDPFLEHVSSARSLPSLQVVRSLVSCWLQARGLHPEAVLQLVSRTRLHRPQFSRSQPLEQSCQRRKSPRGRRAAYHTPRRSLRGWWFRVPKTSVHPDPRPSSKRDAKRAHTGSVAHSTSPQGQVRV